MEGNLFKVLNIELIRQKYINLTFSILFLYVHDLKSLISTSDKGFMPRGGGCHLC